MVTLNLALKGVKAINEISKQPDCKLWYQLAMQKLHLERACRGKCGTYTEISAEELANLTHNTNIEWEPDKRYLITREQIDKGFRVLPSTAQLLPLIKLGIIVEKKSWW